MASIFDTLPHLTTLDQVREVLLQRVPEKYRISFFTSIHPLELTLKDVEIPDSNYQAAIELLRTAIQEQTPTLIFGDYDCDGITATAILWSSLRDAGLTAQPFLPRRDRDGYGLTIPTLERLWQEKPFELLITVDNGIVAHQAVKWAREKSIQVIITDHHAPDKEVPEANVIVHSSHLCGAGVAWMVARGLSPSTAEDLLDLAAIGTLADQVPLYGANRALTIYGLKKLQAETRPSLRHLATLAHIDLKKLSSTGVTFQLAPRLNAMGRLGDPMDALRALLSRSPQRLEQLMSQLEATNQERQSITQDCYMQVQEEVKTLGEDLPNFLVVAGPYHEGIIGLLASRLVDEFQRPAIVISAEGPVWKASCRSLPGCHLVEVLRGLKDVNFLSLGGHELAAGFSLAAEGGKDEIAKIKERTKKIHPINKSKLDSSIVGRLSHQLLNDEIINIIGEFQPFGAKNEEPSFVLEQIEYTKVRPVGSTKQHWKAEIRIPAEDIGFDSIFFKATERYHDTPESVRHAAIRIVPSSFGKRSFDIQVTGLYQEDDTV